MTNVEGVYDDQKKLISEIKPLDLENLIKWKVVQGRHDTQNTKLC
jgi:acetylglutamate kinase